MAEWDGMVLVTGAAGTLGRRVVKNLVNRGISVRGLVRKAEQANALRELGAEAIIGDLTQKSSLAPAVTGVSGIISTAGVVATKGNDSPATVDFQGNCHLIDLAVQANVRHFVLISVIGAQHLRSASLFPAKFHAEQYLRQSGLGWTILRGGAFMPTYQQVGKRGAVRGRYDVIGNPAKPVHFISPDDLAEIAVRALWEPGAWAKTLDVTNDEALTPTAIAAIHSRLFQHPIRLRRLPVALLKVARLPLKSINPAAADFLGFLQAIGENTLAGHPDRIRAAFPGFEFESYETYLTKTRDNDF
jgi:uncharacterized protein YbjT (DUF2867 family)